MIKPELKILRDITALGGIASTAELIVREHPTEMIRLWCDYGRIVRIRQGWYARPELPTDAFRAWRVGGRLACISAAAHLGIEPPRGRQLHVSVTRSSSGHRPATDDRPQHRGEPTPAVVLHWCRARPDGTRPCVSAEAASEQMARCAHLGGDNL